MPLSNHNTSTNEYKNAFTNATDPKSHEYKHTVNLVLQLPSKSNTQNV